MLFLSREKKKLPEEKTLEVRWREWGQDKGSAHKTAQRETNWPRPDRNF